LYFFLDDAAAIPADFFNLDGKGGVNGFIGNEIWKLFFIGRL